MPEVTIGYNFNAHKKTGKKKYAKCVLITFLKIMILNYLSIAAY